MRKNHAPPPLPTLPMHLMLSLTTWLASPFALASAKNALPNWKAKADPEKLLAAINEEAKNRANDFLAGIARYLETPYHRSVAEPPSIWRNGNARLLDYSSGHGAGVITLFVPSLINRYYILDLEHERSMLRFLSSQGVHPLVLDWGEPGAAEKQFDTGKYVSEILLPAIDFLHKTTGRKIALAGYCMGGVFALAAAQLAPKKVSSLSLFATPWNFHCKSFSPFVLGDGWQATMDTLIGKQNTLPADAVQSLFYLTDPWVFEHKFRRFFGMDAKSRAARDFVALEHWVNDGVPMTANVARDCLIGWAQQNRLMAEGWQLMNKKIDPRKIQLPAFLAIPKNDHVVPYDCAWPLAAMMKNATVIHPSAGHVGMIVGQRAKKELWQPLADWLLLHRS